MKARLLMPFAVLGLIHCAPNETPVRLLSTHALESGQDNGACTLQDIGQYSGSLDIGTRGSYLIGVMASSEISDTSEFGGTTDFVGAVDRNTFIGNEILLSYAAKGLSIPKETMPAHLTIRQGSRENEIVFNLIGPNAATVLFDNVAVGDTPIPVNVSLSVKGALLSGQPLQTNTVVYPIQVYKSGVTICGAMDKPVLNGPCGSAGGQDGAPYLCCSANAAGTGCK